MRAKRVRRPYDDLVREVARVEELPLEAVRRTVERFTMLLPEVVWDLGRLSVPGFAVFRVRRRKARRICNPQSGALMTLPRGRAVTIRAAGSWRRRDG